MSAMASQITSLMIVYSTVYSGTDQSKHQSSASVAFVRGIHRWPVNSPNKGPLTRKIFPFGDIIMYMYVIQLKPTKNSLRNYFWLNPVISSLGLCPTARTRKDSEPRNSGLDLPNRSTILQAHPQQQRCRDAYQISERFDHYNITAQGYRDFSRCGGKTFIVYWTEALWRTICSK